MQPQWYVVHTYTGYERRVATNLERIVENRKLGDLIFSVKIPVETVVDPNDETKTKEVMLFPGYVFVKMIHNDESWHIVRYTSGVTGFVGPGSHPEPLKDSEVEQFKLVTKTVQLGFAVGDEVELVSGLMKDYIKSAKVLEISEDFKHAKVSAMLSGRQTTIELEASDLRKVKD